MTARNGVEYTNEAICLINNDVYKWAECLGDDGDDDGNACRMQAKHSLNILYGWQRIERSHRPSSSTNDKALNASVFPIYDRAFLYFLQIQNVVFNNTSYHIMLLFQTQTNATINSTHSDWRPGGLNKSALSTNLKTIRSKREVSLHSTPTRLVWLPFVFVTIAGHSRGGVREPELKLFLFCLLASNLLVPFNKRLSSIMDSSQIVDIVNPVPQ
uniref:Uncharacterized protein n=1 Tax=Glossina pallidipes TaxID=7398 RepID=A0A1B0AB37_GLOPL